MEVTRAGAAQGRLAREKLRPPEPPEPTVLSTCAGDGAARGSGAARLP